MKRPIQSSKFERYIDLRLYVIMLWTQKVSALPELWEVSLISGCNHQGVCYGDLIDSEVVPSKLDCLNECNVRENCKFYSYSSQGDFCLLFSSCHELDETQEYFQTSAIYCPEPKGKNIWTWSYVFISWYFKFLFILSSFFHSTGYNGNFKVISFFITIWFFFAL